MNENTSLESFDLDMLYRECFTPVFRYLYLRTRDYDLASDITQTTFLKYMKQENGPNTVEHARRLLFTISKNLLIDNWRSGANNKNVRIDDIDEIKSDLINQEEESIKKDDIEYLNLVLNNLNEIEQEIINMRLTLEFDYETISKELNISEANARKIYSRTLHKVGDTLKNSGHF